MKAKDLNDLVVYHDAIDAEDAGSAILGRGVFCQDRELKDQLSRSSSRVTALIAEGYGQLTDKHVAVYLGRARGSCYESRTHLRKAYQSNFIYDRERQELSEKYVVIGKKLSKWIGYLQRSNWKRRS